jgi:hypothetical protein
LSHIFNLNCGLLTPVPFRMQPLPNAIRIQYIAPERLSFSFLSSLYFLIHCTLYSYVYVKHSTFALVIFSSPFIFSVFELICLLVIALDAHYFSCVPASSPQSYTSSLVLRVMSSIRTFRTYEYTEYILIKCTLMNTNFIST